MATEFPIRARRDDPNGHMVVQQMLEFLRDAFDTQVGKIAFGEAVVASGDTWVEVTSGVISADFAAVVTPLVDPGGRYWLSNLVAGQFRINLQVAAPVGGVAFDWIVKGG